MRDKIVPLLIVLGLSMFCAFVVIVPGLGALDSPLNRIAGPTVCGEESLEIEKDSNAYIQGEQTHLVTAYCVDEQGTRRDVSNQLLKAIQQLQVVTGIISSLIIFALAMLFLRWAARRLNLSFEDMFKPSVRRKN